MQNQKVNIKKNLSYFFKSSIKTIKLIDENQINKMVDGIRKLKSKKGRIFCWKWWKCWKRFSRS